MCANVIAANLRINGLESNVNGIVNDVSSLESTVTGLLVGGIYAYSNSNVASYLPVDSTIVSLRGNIIGANAAIVTANTALKNYVDSQVSANAYSNVKVATYLESATGNINAGYINADNQIVTSGLYSTELGVTGSSALTTVIVPVEELSTVSGSVVINAAAGDWQSLVTGGAISISSFSNWPSAGTKGSITLQVLVASTSHTITFPATISGMNGVTGYLPSAFTWTAPVTGTYVFNFSTVDGGATVIASESNSILKPYISTVEAITNTGNAIISLGTTYSIYRTASNGTAFMGNGVAGQIKVISSGVADTWAVSFDSSLWPSKQLTFTNPGQTITCLWNSSLNQWVALNVFGSVSFS